jgi:predicted phage terminase large subunit-like protein
LTTATDGAARATAVADEAGKANAVRAEAERLERETLRERAKIRCAIDTLAGFVRYLWPEIEPGRPLVWAWYLDLLCAELEGLARGEAPDGTPYPDDGAELVVCLPPGHAKSRLCSVFFPAWLWLHIPHLRLITRANEGELAARDSRLSREVLKTEAFAALQLRLALDRGEAVIDEAAVDREGRPLIRPTVDAGPGGGGGGGGGGRVVLSDQEWRPWSLSVDQAAKVNFDLTAANGTLTGGGRNAAGIFAMVTGKRGDGLIVDDPADAKEVIVGDPDRVAERMRMIRVLYHGALQSRLNAGAWRLVVAQRLHVADLPGDLIDRGSRVVCLPLHYDPEHPDVHADDPRQPGELLAPAVLSEERGVELRRRLTPRHADAQYEQRPSSMAGNLFKREWFGRHYQGIPLELARRGAFDAVEVSVDCAFRDHDKADYVCASVWGRKRRRSLNANARNGANARDSGGLAPGKYLLDVFHGRMGLFETCAMLRRVRGKWPWGRLVLVEAKANGDAVIETMRKEGHGGVVGYEPDRSKVARAEVSALAHEAGEVWYPLEEHAPWLADWVEEHVAFPAGANDDQVDSASQLFCRWAVIEADDIAGELAWVDLL